MLRGDGIVAASFDIPHSAFDIPMDPLESVFNYHVRTKHHFQRFAASLGYLDWATQPNPFRRYEGAPLHPLSLSGQEPGAGYDDLFRPGAIAAQPANHASISALFEFSLALSAWKEFQGSRWALRINPSSGNLHPTEGYLVAGPIEGLHDGAAVYHYAPKEHALERRCDLSEHAAAMLPADTFLIGLTSIHWRETWKYGERAFRYCQQDVGHALAAVSFSVARLGWTAGIVAATDDQIGVLLGLEREEDFAAAEREHPDLLLVVSPDDPVVEMPQIGTFGTGSSAVWHGRANTLSRNHVDWPIIDEVARATRRVDAISRDVSRAESPPAIVTHRVSNPARSIIRQRRSAVSFDGSTSISAETFYLVLDRTLPRLDRPPWNALGPPACVHLALFVHLVVGLPKGLYMLVRDAEKLSGLRECCDAGFAWTRPDGCPTDLPLFHLKAGDARRVAAQVSCGQEIAGMSAFSLGMIAEFDEPIRKHGAWFYRRLFWETGAIGQVLYLEAEAAGVRGTGIGCFFDDPVHDLLGLKDRRFQSLYHFTVGGAVEDPRLITLTV